jgi:ABC-type multidrug transport system ATPase subunit
VNVDFDEVRATGVSRHFGRRRALHQISFSCRAGDVLGLLGPNGAGKSTLLAIASTLLRPSSGALLYGTHDASHGGAPLRQRLGWLGHELQLYPELTARENLTFFARLQGVADVDARVARALVDARLELRADDLVSRFSRGMRQRLALERALLHDPRLLLLDEPFTGLDGPSTAALAARLARLAGEGRLVMLATHDVDLADDVLTRALILRDGRLLDDISGRGWRQAYRAALSRES